LFGALDALLASVALDASSAGAIEAGGALEVLPLVVLAFAF
jgi:hypothetical protein